MTPMQGLLNQNKENITTKTKTDFKTLRLESTERTSYLVPTGGTSDPDSSTLES